MTQNRSFSEQKLELKIEFINNLKSAKGADIKPQ